MIQIDLKKNFRREYKALSDLELYIKTYNDTFTIIVSEEFEPRYHFTLRCFIDQEECYTYTAETLNDIIDFLNQVRRNLDGDK